MTDWRWIDPSVVDAIHDRQIEEHGGHPGTRDQGLIESAMARPRMLAADGEPDVFDLAAAYGCLACNHGFIDGNKRTAYVVCRQSRRAASYGWILAVFPQHVAGEVEGAADQDAGGAGLASDRAERARHVGRRVGSDAECPRQGGGVGGVAARRLVRHRHRGPIARASRVGGESPARPWS